MLTYILATVALLYLGYKLIVNLPQRAEELEITEDEHEWYFDGKGSRK